MLVLTAIRKILQDDSSIAGAATGGIHMVDVPADSERPNIMIMLISDADGWTHQGPDGLQQGIARIYSRGDTLEQAVTLGKTIKTVLNGYVSTADIYGLSIELLQHSNSNGDYQDAAKVYRQIDDYRFTYRES